MRKQRHKDCSSLPSADLTLPQARGRTSSQGRGATSSRAAWPSSGSSRTRCRVLASPSASTRTAKLTTRCWRATESCGSRSVRPRGQSLTRSASPRPRTPTTTAVAPSTASSARRASRCTSPTTPAASPPASATPPAGMRSWRTARRCSSLAVGGRSAPASATRCAVPALSLAHTFRRGAFRVTSNLKRRFVCAGLRGEARQLQPPLHRDLTRPRHLPRRSRQVRHTSAAGRAFPLLNFEPRREFRHRVGCVRLAHTHLEQCAGISSTFNKQALVVIQFAGTTQNGVNPDGFFTNPDTHEQESLCLMSNTKVRSSPASSRLCPRLLIKSVRACVVPRRITSAASVWCSSPATRTPTAP